MERVYPMELQYSNIRYISNYEQSQSLYDYKMYALVHVDAESCARDALEPLGYEILLRLVRVCVYYLLLLYQ